jgi:hypothetical protein
VNGKTFNDDERGKLEFNKIAYFDCLRGPAAHKMKATAYHVLSLIYHYSNGDGTNAHPGTERLARECGVTTRAVEKALAQLLDRGFISVQREGGGPGKATVYRLSIPEQIFGVVGTETPNAGAENPRTLAQEPRTLAHETPNARAEKPRTNLRATKPYTKPSYQTISTKPGTSAASGECACCGGPIVEVHGENFCSTSCWGTWTRHRSRVNVSESGT